MRSARLRKNDLVEVIAGRNKGERGRILLIQREQNLVVVEKVNMVKRHQSPQRYQQAGIIEKEAPINASNVMLVDSKSDKPTRVRFSIDKDGIKTRVAAKSGAVLES